MPNKVSKTTEECASALMSPIRWCSVNCLHKRVRLNWTKTHCRCILDDIEMKLFSRKTNEMCSVVTYRLVFRTIYIFK